MSSSTVSSTTGSPTSSPTNPINPDGGGTNNQLYLFTFLTTLLLLLAVSSGIVLRSFIIRRRFRRRVEAAIAAGVLLPEQVDALRRRGPVLGEKPRIWEVRIDKGFKEGYEAASSSSHHPGLTESEWSEIMPVAAAIIPGARTSAAEPSHAPDVPPSDLSTAPSSSRRLWPFARRQARGPLLPTSSSDPRPSSLSADTDAVGESSAMPLEMLKGGPKEDDAQDRLQVTVMIAMPNPNNRMYNPAAPSLGGGSGSDLVAKGKEHGSLNGDDEEEEIPEVVFGVTELLWDHGSAWKPKHADAKVDAKEDDSNSPATH